MMAVVMRMKGVGASGGGGNEKNPLFHDFLGMTASSSPAADPPATPWPKGSDGGTKASEAAEPMASASPSASVSLGASSGGHGLLSGTSDLGSERQGVNNSEGFHFHGRKNAMLGPDYLSGKKRNCPDLEYSGFIKDGVLQIGSDQVERSHLYKMFGKEVVSEQLGRSRDNELLFPTQTSPTAGSIMPHHSHGSRPDSPLPRWERCVPVNPGRIVQKASRFAHIGTNFEKASPSYTQKDASTGATVISQSAADEGSRTGIKGSGFISSTNRSNESGERSSIAVLPSANVGKNVEQELYNLPRCHITPSAGRQMTIFYAGQAHVFDDVHPNKADVIMSLAGSSGGSWMTTYAATSTGRPTTTEAKVPSRQEKDNGMNQASRILSGSDTSNLRAGGHQSVVTARDGRPMIQAAAGPQTEGKRGDV